MTTAGPPPPDRFWLGLCPLPADAVPEGLRAQLPQGVSGTLGLVVDLVKSAVDEGGCTVLLSVLQQPDQYRQGPLQCMLAFSNRTARVDGLRERGFRALEAVIEFKPTGDVFDVSVAPLVSTVQGDAAAPAEPPTLEILGLRFAPPKGAVATRDYDMCYAQAIYVPDAGVASRELLRRDEQVASGRKGIHKLPGSATLRADGAGLLLLLSTSRSWQLQVPQQWCGRLDGSVDDLLAPRPRSASKAQRQLRTVRSDALRPPTGFRFEEVELIGLRIDLRSYGEAADDMLERLVSPLNFHLQDPAARGAGNRLSFRYRPAARTLVMEVLRYGRMFFGDRAPDKDVPAEPYESQYELLFRVLVGRVDDGSAEARDPAVFVPVLFVDSALSRLYGRELQGFDKRMASFIGNDERVLAPAGAGRRGCGLADFRKLQAVAQLPVSRDKNMDLLWLDLPTDLQQWFDCAEPVDDLARSVIASRWRQGDFSQKEFRRSFARRVLAEGLEQFRSIQVAPVDGRPLPKAWITGTFDLHGLRAAFPTGIATLRLLNEPLLPEPLRELNTLVKGEPIALGCGDWYVGRCGIRMRLEDGLV